LARFTVTIMAQCASREAGSTHASSSSKSSQ
jgi:hypothetical protein